MPLPTTIPRLSKANVIFPYTNNKPLQTILHLKVKSSRNKDNSPSRHGSLCSPSMEVHTQSLLGHHHQHQFNPIETHASTSIRTGRGGGMCESVYANETFKILTNTFYESHALHGWLVGRISAPSYSYRSEALSSSIHLLLRIPTYSPGNDAIYISQAY